MVRPSSCWVDTGGIEPRIDDGLLAHMRSWAQLAIDSADCIVMVTELSAGVTPQDQDVARMLMRSGKPVALAVNKCDKVGEPPYGAVRLLPASAWAS